MPYIKFSPFFILIISAFIFSCRPNYSKYANQYQFSNATNIPDYANLQYWAAHPWKNNLSDSVPAPLKNELRDSLVDVFFIHPTTYTGTKKN